MIKTPKMEYERLTNKLNKMNASGKLDYTDYCELFDMAIDLQELEDKIENGTMIEIPCIIPSSTSWGTEQFRVYYYHKTGFGALAIETDCFYRKEHAEARLKELKENKQ